MNKQKKSLWRRFADWYKAGSKNEAPAMNEARTALDEGQKPNSYTEAQAQKNREAAQQTWEARYAQHKD